MESLVENAEALTRIFGHWPSFHDAEVLSMRFERGGEGGPSLEARIHVFHMTRDVDPAGFYVLTHHTVVTFAFHHILLIKCKWFNGQNVLSDLLFEAVDPATHSGRGIGVYFEETYGVDAELACDRVIVTEVVAENPKEGLGGSYYGLPQPIEP
jgi:hypothetical protein